MRRRLGAAERAGGGDRPVRGGHGDRAEARARRRSPPCRWTPTGAMPSGASGTDCTRALRRRRRSSTPPSRQHAKRLAASNPEAMREMKRVFWAGTEQLGAGPGGARRDERPHGALGLHPRRRSRSFAPASVPRRGAARPRRPRTFPSSRPAPHDAPRRAPPAPFPRRPGRVIPRQTVPRPPGRDTPRAP